jgi:hypothetical protein
MKQLRRGGPFGPLVLWVKYRLSSNAQEQEADA